MDQKNHIKSNRVKYLNTEIKYIDMKLKRYVSKINTIFILESFQEFIKVLNIIMSVWRLIQEELNQF